MKKPYITLSNIIAEIVSIVLAFVSLIITGVKALTTKSQIAIHFDANGNPDGYGSPVSLMVIPLIMLGVIFVIILMAHFMPPTMMNLPFKLNPERKLMVYHDAILGIDLFAVEMGLFAVITAITATNESFPTPLAIALVAVSIVTEIFCMVKAYIDNKM